MSNITSEHNAMRKLSIYSVSIKPDSAIVVEDQ